MGRSSASLLSATVSAGIVVKKQRLRACMEAWPPVILVVAAYAHLPITAAVKYHHFLHHGMFCYIPSNQHPYSPRPAMVMHGLFSPGVPYPRLPRSLEIENQARHIKNSERSSRGSCCRRSPIDTLFRSKQNGAGEGTIISTRAGEGR